MIASALRGGKVPTRARPLGEEVGVGLLEMGELASSEIGAGVMVDES